VKESQYEKLLVSLEGEVGLVTINRPGDRNSIDTGLMEELTRVLADLEQAFARAVIFTGSGEVYFIGGADGVEMMQCAPDGAQRFSRRIQELFGAMEASPLILLAAINGLCFGGGFEFAMACDLRVASEKARIGLPEVKVGIIPGGGGTQRLPRLVGAGLAMEMILSGRLYSGPTAERMGLVHRVAPAERIMDESHALLKNVLRNPGHAIVQAKRAVKAAQKEPMARGLEIEAEAFSRCFEEGYFKDLMHDQLESGELKTTMPYPKDGR
jgi:enoyl-CoA hydratase/carnithine racemase